MYCPYCGEKQNDGRNVCQKCEKNLAKLNLNEPEELVESTVSAENKETVTTPTLMDIVKKADPAPAAAVEPAPVEVVNPTPAAPANPAPAAPAYSAPAAPAYSAPAAPAYSAPANPAPAAPAYSAPANPAPTAPAVSQNEKYIKRSFWNLTAAAVLTMVTVLYGIFGIGHLYTTGFGIGTIAEHIHLFHLGYSSAVRVEAYIFAALAIANAAFAIYFKSKTMAKFIPYENKIEVLVLAVAIVSFAVPVLMSVFPMIEA